MDLIDINRIENNDLKYIYNLFYNYIPTMQYNGINSYYY